ncbi:hypothetical protein HLB23_27875 [Nocardia uniformis]|uniref:Uncharacterized protein n=1 Tax=Nocardia uniformis TaxID=53432 RepID=A0A849C794_9NOCA|nr:hypothetical protein [Nocardia uniformis]NNH73626.1 hypothetical protein [Nocardia uniformis]
MIAENTYSGDSSVRNAYAARRAAQPTAVPSAWALAAGSCRPELRRGVVVG